MTRPSSPVLAARGQSRSVAFGHTKTSGFQGSCSPGTPSLMCSRLFLHSLLAEFCAMSDLLAPLPPNRQRLADGASEY